MPQVDLVLEGGGVRGIALVGAWSLLAERGYQAVRVAGTSAGAIAAAFLVAGYTPGALRDEVLDFSFVKLRDLGWEDRVPLAGPLLSLLLDFGLYEGDALEEWLRARLGRRGVRTFADLPQFEGECRLQVVVSDLSERRLLLLPRDAAVLGVGADELEVARVLRMSASLPFYFEPVKWRAPGGDKTHLLVDGGLLSNFPVWAFDVPGVPRWPTFGLLLVEAEPRDPLGSRLPPAPEQMNALDYLEALVSTALEAHDRQHLDEADFVRTVAIPTLGVRTTQFDLSRAQALALYEAGRSAAERFLDSWDFEGYLCAFREGPAPGRRELLARELRRAKGKEV